MEPIIQNALKIDIRGTQGNYVGTWFSDYQWAGKYLNHIEMNAVIWSNTHWTVASYFILGSLDI